MARHASEWMKQTPTSLQAEQAVGDDAGSCRTLLWCLEGTVRIKTITCTGNLRNQE